MKIRIFALLLCALPYCAALGADRSISTSRISVSAIHNVGSKTNNVATKNVGVVNSTSANTNTVVVNENCREEYRACMDELCLMDEGEGARCACSENIHKSKNIIQEIEKIQEETRDYLAETERERLGAKASLVLDKDISKKKTQRYSRIVDEDTDDLGTDDDIGEALYLMASEQCASILNSCGDKADMEKLLYERQIVADCKAYDVYLKEQKSFANAEKEDAYKGLINMRDTMLEAQLNELECFSAYKSCITDKGGCGANFENCLDEDLLNRRAGACEYVLDDNCLARRSNVLTLWNNEKYNILNDAKKYADINVRQTCNDRVEDCLSRGCSIETNSACLTDINVAAGICPVINECEELVPGFKKSIQEKLGALRVEFCENDVIKCLRNKCGENYDRPECVGKNVTDVAQLCPQSMFPSCKNESQFDKIVQGALWQVEYQLSQGCLNYFAEQLGKVCGTDLSCLPSDPVVEALTKSPKTEEERTALYQQVRDSASVAADNFMKQFEKDKTVAACQKGQRQLGDTVFSQVKIAASISAENRAIRALQTKILQLKRQEGLESAEERCLSTYRVEKPDTSRKNYSYIRSVSFEPSLNNCHVCRMQQVCEIGGQSKRGAFTEGAAGGASVGASIGSLISPGLGTAIGTATVAGLGGLANMLLSKGEQEFCQEIESCEDINVETINM